jgi:hypothetical protein
MSQYLHLPQHGLHLLEQRRWNTWLLLVVAVVAALAVVVEQEDLELQQDIQLLLETLIL